VRLRLHRVADRDIRRAAVEGFTSMEDLTARTGCGSTCGCCREYAVEALPQAHAMPLRLPVAA